MARVQVRELEVRPQKNSCLLSDTLKKINFIQKQRSVFSIWDDSELVKHSYPKRLDWWSYANWEGGL